jgi:1,4-alpha-glucan branching enzyme
MMFAHPGRKLLFMGSELAPWTEWNHEGELDWYLESNPTHAGVKALVRDLNRHYLARPELHALDDEPAGFQWVDCSDVDQTTLSWLRFGPEGTRGVLLVANLTPIPRYSYHVGVPKPGHYREIVNTNAKEYGGTGQGNLGGVASTTEAAHGYPQSVSLTLPPLTALLFELPPLNSPSSPAKVKSRRAPKAVRSESNPGAAAAPPGVKSPKKAPRSRRVKSG